MLSPSVRASRLRLLIFVLFLVPPAVRAQSAECIGPLTRQSIVGCALAQSPTIAGQRAELASAEGRREAARPFLPSNPVLSGSVGTRASPEARATNWAVTLAQELEVAGQSGLRTEAAEEEVQGQQYAVSVARAEVAELAWRSWFEVLAAQERVQLALRGERASGEVARTTAAMLANGLSSEVEVAVAEASYAGAVRVRLDAERALRASEVQLRSLLNAPNLSWAGGLDPLAWDGTRAERPEALTLQRLGKAAGRRVELLRRERIPNPTLSVTVQNDGFNERVVAVGLGLPVPLPQPLGRTNAGQIAEAAGAAARITADVERLSRQLEAERRTAQADFEQWKAARALYSAPRVAQANRALEGIAEQLSASRISVREALTSQQALVEFLSAEVDAREQLCLASVRLIRAEGASLEGRDL